MADLIATPAFDGLLPLEIGGHTLRDATPGTITAISPFRGQDDALSSALSQKFGLALPGPRGSTAAEGVQLLWAGIDHLFLVGAEVSTGDFAGIAALTDQSDAWAVADLTGPATDAVLARLCPLDLSPTAFPEGSTARSLIGHMSALITRTGPETLRLMVFRSMAGTLVHELEVAMRSLAARGALAQAGNSSPR